MFSGTWVDCAGSLQAIRGGRSRTRFLLFNYCCVCIWKFLANCGKHSILFASESIFHEGISENIIIFQAEALRDSFPPSDKSLSKLLGDSPHLPKSVLKLLESFCCPGSGEVEKDLQHGDRVTQGLSAVWSLILMRPGIRNDCLNIALQVPSISPLSWFPFLWCSFSFIILTFQDFIFFPALCLWFFLLPFLAFFFIFSYQHLTVSYCQGCNIHFFCLWGTH